MCQTNQIGCVQIKYGIVSKCLWLRSVSLLALMLDGAEKVDKKHITEKLQFGLRSFRCVAWWLYWCEIHSNHVCLVSVCFLTHFIHSYLSIRQQTETKNGNICSKQLDRDHVSGESDTCCYNVIAKGNKSVSVSLTCLRYGCGVCGSLWKSQAFATNQLHKNNCLFSTS